ncbi:MAG: ATP-grasp domain-containing protein [Candidatus Levybacteria bacterium]|nr:ATP-grasp domain-containing protein [Candidatus Levybacteria bacterium]
MHQFKNLEHKYDFFYYNEIGKDPYEYVDFVITDLLARGVLVDGVIGDQDDTSILASLAAKKLGLIGPDPQAIFRAQHKAYFSVFAAKANNYFPPTYVLNPSVRKFPDLPFPGFEKPSKGSLSRFAYMVRTPKELRKRLDAIERAPRKYLRWFDTFFHSQYEADKHVKKPYIPINTLLYQPLLSFDQYTVDGLVQHGKITILGYTKSDYSEDRKSFVSFNFPSELSKNLNDEVQEVLKKLLQLLGYDNAGFNLEFFVTDRDHMIIIEFNTRLSGQFIPLMQQWYKSNNLDFAIQIALGNKPIIQSRKEKKLASSFPLRIHRDFLVEYIPDEKYYKRLKEKFDILEIRIMVDQGKKLSDYPQDGYSFRYAIVDIAGKTKQEIHDKLELVKMNLGIVFRPV